MIEHSARSQHEWGDKTEQSDQEERDEWGMLTVLEYFPGQEAGSYMSNPDSPRP